MNYLKNIVIVGIILFVFFQPALGDPAINIMVKQSGIIISPGDEVAVDVPIDITVTYTNLRSNLDQTWNIGYDKTDHLLPWDVILETGTHTGETQFTETAQYTPTEIGIIYIAADCLETGSSPTDFYYAYHVTNMNIVPEPATIAMSIMGMLAVIGFVWSRKEE